MKSRLTVAALALMIFLLGANIVGAATLQELRIQTRSQTGELETAKSAVDDSTWDRWVNQAMVDLTSATLINLEQIDGYIDFAGVTENKIFSGHLAINSRNDELIAMDALVDGIWRPWPNYRAYRKQDEEAPRIYVDPFGLPKRQKYPLLDPKRRYTINEKVREVVSVCLFSGERDAIFLPQVTNVDSVTGPSFYVSRYAADSADIVLLYVDRLAEKSHVIEYDGSRVYTLPTNVSQVKGAVCWNFYGYQLMMLDPYFAADTFKTTRRWFVDYGYDGSQQFEDTVKLFLAGSDFSTDTPDSIEVFYSRGAGFPDSIDINYISTLDDSTDLSILITCRPVEMAADGTECPVDDKFEGFIVKYATSFYYDQLRGVEAGNAIRQSVIKEVEHLKAAGRQQ